MSDRPDQPDDRARTHDGRSDERHAEGVAWSARYRALRLRREQTPDPLVDALGAMSGPRLAGPDLASSVLDRVAQVRPFVPAHRRWMDHALRLTIAAAVLACASVSVMIYTAHRQAAMGPSSLTQIAAGAARDASVLREAASALRLVDDSTLPMVESIEDRAMAKAMSAGDASVRGSGAPERATARELLAETPRWVTTIAGSRLSPTSLTAQGLISSRVESRADGRIDPRLVARAEARGRARLDGAGVGGAWTLSSTDVLLNDPAADLRLWTDPVLGSSNLPR